MGSKEILVILYTAKDHQGVQTDQTDHSEDWLKSMFHLLTFYCMYWNKS